jgi:hypothetical protein
MATPIEAGILLASHSDFRRGSGQGILRIFRLFSCRLEVDRPRFSLLGFGKKSLN